MTEAERERFVRDLISRIEKSVLEAVPRMPDEWGKQELNRYIIQRTEHTANFRPMTATEIHEYAKACLDRNL